MKTILILLLAVGLIGVFVSVRSPATHHPVRVVVLQELSDDAYRNGAPMYSEANHEALLAGISKTGGEMAFGVITGHDSPLVRAVVSGTSNAYDNQRRRTRLAGFRNEVIQRLSTPLAADTQLAAALERAGTFLNEASGRAARQFLILIDSGGHSAGKTPLPQLPDNVTLLVVGGARKSTLPGARYVESVSAAILAITSQTN